MIKGFSSLITSVMTFVAFSFVSSANAQQVYWKKQTVDIKFNGNSSVSNFNGIFQKVLTTPVAYECGYNQEPQVEVRPGTCYDVSCAGGAGRSPNWDEYYSAKKAEKASKLAKAIKGVGKISSEALVKANYFSSKPRSWDAFKSEINSAAANGLITPQVKAMILSTYRDTNIANLGYASGSCQARAYACGEEIVVVQDGGYVQQTCVENVEQVIDQKAMNYTFDVKGAVLLPTETETIRVELTGDPSDASIQSSDYNTYAAQINQTSIYGTVMNLQATGRKQVALPYAGLQTVALIPSSPSQATLQVTVSPAILPATASETLVIQYQVRTCQIGFLGTCGIGWDKVDNYVGKVTGNISTFGAPITLAKGRKGLKMEVEVKVYKQNSMYHNATPISKTSDKIVLK